MKISIVIINYNTFDLTSNCIKSVYEHTKVNFEIVLIDNASVECDASLFLDKFPQITLKKNTQNIGFGRACNQGVKLAKGEYILLLNSDTLLTYDVIDRSIEKFEKFDLGDINVLGVRQVDESGHDVSFAEKKHNIFWSILNRDFRVSFDTEKKAQESGWVDILYGSYLLFKREFFESTSGFDPDFFLYYEETDWLRKFDKKYLSKDLEVIHFQGGSSVNIQKEIKRQFRISEALYIFKLGRFRYLFFLSFTLYLHLLKFLLSPLMKKENRPSEIQRFKSEVRNVPIYVQIFFHSRRVGGRGGNSLRVNF